MAMSDSQRYPCNLYLIYNVEDSVVFFIFKKVNNAFKLPIFKKVGLKGLINEENETFHEPTIFIQSLYNTLYIATNSRVLQETRFHLSKCIIMRL